MRQIVVCHVSPTPSHWLVELTEYTAIIESGINGTWVLSNSKGKGLLEQMLDTPKLTLTLITVHCHLFHRC